mgnify:CR=1 FL=1
MGDFKCPMCCITYHKIQEFKFWFKDDSVCDICDIITKSRLKFRLYQSQKERDRLDKINTI